MLQFASEVSGEDEELHYQKRHIPKQYRDRTNGLAVLRESSMWQIRSTGRKRRPDASPGAPPAGRSAADVAACPAAEGEDGADGGRGASSLSPPAFSPSPISAAAQAQLLCNGCVQASSIRKILAVRAPTSPCGFETFPALALACSWYAVLHVRTCSHAAAATTLKLICWHGSSDTPCLNGVTEVYSAM